ncbi:MAG: AAC(3) family N-acetyltransferase [Pseudomonadota bacterium]
MRLVPGTGNVGSSDLAEQLSALGLVPGDAVFVEGAMAELGPVVGGARAVVEALISVLGSQGLLMMPAFSSDALLPALPDNSAEAERARVEACVPGYDPSLSPADLSGTLAETFRRWPGVERSNHPVYSIAALGPDAGEAVAQHPRDWAMGPEGPMGRLLEQREPKLLMIGCSWAASAALVMAETMARHRRLRVLRFKDTSRQPFRWVHARDTALDDGTLFQTVGQRFERTGHVTIGAMAAATARLCRLDELLAHAAPSIAFSNFQTGTASPHASPTPSQPDRRRQGPAYEPRRGTPATY